MLLGSPSPDPDQGLLIIDLSTKRGNRIPNIQRATRHPDSMAVAQAVVLKHHPTAKLRSLRSEYNCVGMVFASRRTAIEPEYVPMILRDDGYRPVDQEDALEVGDVVVYRTRDGEISHIGIIAIIKESIQPPYREIIVLSQWGSEGEYFHRIDDVNPLLGQASEFWTDRK